MGTLNLIIINSVMYISDYLLDHLICGFTGFSLFSFILKLLNGDRRCLLLTLLISSLTVLTFSIDESGIYATRDAAKNVAKTCSGLTLSESNYFIMTLHQKLDMHLASFNV